MTRCEKKGHKWWPMVLHSLGRDRCRRRGCTATRTNPRMMPPEVW